MFFNVSDAGFGGRTHAATCPIPRSLHPSRSSPNLPLTSPHLSLPWFPTSFPFPSHIPGQAPKCHPCRTQARSGDGKQEGGDVVGERALASELASELLHAEQHIAAHHSERRLPELST
jgi:hypothetical protein